MKAHMASAPLAAVVLASAIMAPGAIAQDMDTTFAAPADGQLDVYNHEGTVEVTTWDRDAVRVRARWDGGRRPIGIRGQGSRVRVKVEPKNAGMPYVAFEITIPRRMSVAVQGVEVATRVRGAEGNVAVQSVEGSIDVDGGRGNISLQAVEGPVSVRNARGKIAINSVEGGVTIDNVSGALTVESVDGNVILNGIDSDNVSVNAVDGDVRFVGTIKDDGRYFMSTHDGDLDITIPRNANARVSIATFDGEVKADIPIQLEGDFTQKRFSFTIGTGRALMELSSFDGVIRLTRGN